nr:hypothetical protein GCM10020092_006380 [Actinoplanes digitatis]
MDSGYALYGGHQAPVNGGYDYGYSEPAAANGAGWSEPAANGAGWSEPAANGAGWSEPAANGAGWQDAGFASAERLRHARWLGGPGGSAPTSGHVPDYAPEAIYGQAPGYGQAAGYDQAAYDQAAELRPTGRLRPADRL